MSKAWTLSCLLDDISARAEAVDGKVFLNRNASALHELTEKIASYPTNEEAQFWINIIPLSDYFDDLLGSWDCNDIVVSTLIEKISDSTLRNLRSQFPEHILKGKILFDDDELMLQIMEATR